MMATTSTSSPFTRSTFDPELRSVLELATDSEFYFSPLLKSIENRGNADFIMIEEDFEERDNFIELLESRFLYLGADARSTLSDITLQHGLSQWKVQAFAALKIGAVELKSMILKGGGMLTLAKVYQLLARRLSGKMLFQAANYQVRHELIRELAFYGSRCHAYNTTFGVRNRFQLRPVR
ncbi:hypothetical protein C5167_050360 [Papaver somniferum]|uniref:Uncharacterized protein n=1 Tax=Papaver somniferum TaxID=3469 RepID=A0A4Y7KRA8_PAPSO|nr:hypothetical protein C5167_050360 [Papaver somniferum]